MKMEDGLMTLKILLPYGIFLERRGVKKVTAETGAGSFGLLPMRLDCAAALAPGILCYETAEEGEVLIAVDAGTLVKAGREVMISVRGAFGGSGRGSLREAVKKQFISAGERERAVRESLAKLEISLIRRFEEYGHER